MDTHTFTTTDLKHNTGEIINLVAFDKIAVSIKRHGKIIATIVPARALPKTKNFAAILQEYSGSIPRFPDVIEDRTLNTRRFGLDL